MKKKGKIALTVLLMFFVLCGLTIGVAVTKKRVEAKKELKVESHQIDGEQEFHYRDYTIKLLNYQYSSYAQNGEISLEVSKDNGEMEKPDMMSGGQMVGFGKAHCMRVFLNGSGSIESKGKMSDGKLFVTTKFDLSEQKTGQPGYDEIGQIGIRTVDTPEEENSDPKMTYHLKNTEPGMEFTSGLTKVKMSSKRIRILSPIKQAEYVIEVELKNHKKKKIFDITKNMKKASSVTYDNSEKYQYEYAANLNKGVDIDEIEHVYVNGEQVK